MVDEPQDASQKRTRNVLLIEDNVFSAALFQAYLEARPAVRLLSAMQGHVGLDLARGHQPFLILLGLKLPDLSVEQVLRTLRADPRTEKAQVFILDQGTAWDRPDHLRMLGASGLLTMPMTQEAFVALVDLALDADRGAD